MADCETCEYFNCPCNEIVDGGNKMEIKEVIGEFKAAINKAVLTEYGTSKFQISVEALSLAIDLLQKVEDGEYVKLPCKVGDTIFVDTKTLTKKYSKWIKDMARLIKKVPLDFYEEVYSLSPIYGEFLEQLLRMKRKDLDKLVERWREAENNDTKIGL